MTDEVRTHPKNAILLGRSLQILFLCAFSSLTLALARPSGAADITVGGSKLTIHGKHQSILLSGEIKEGDTLKLQNLFANELSDPGGVNQPYILSLDSPGGSLTEALALARYVRNRGLATYVERSKQCLSGCAMVFMAGTYWTEGLWFPRRIMHQKAVIGFHAPFAAISSDNIAPDVAMLLLEGLDRQASLNAVAIMDLVVEDILPASLARDLMMHDKSSFRYIDRLYDLGRWGIELAGAEKLGAPGGIIQNSQRALLEQFCINQKNWTLDISFEDRTTDPADAAFTQWALYERCVTEVSGEQFVYKYANETISRSGPVRYWKSLPPELRLSALSDADLTPPDVYISPFDPRNEPPSQVDGECLSGFQWVGGWSGFAWSDSIAHATYRSCSNGQVTQIPFVLNCRHGDKSLEAIIRSPGLATLDLTQPSPVLVDGIKVGHAFGKKASRNGLPRYTFGIERQGAVIVALKQGKVLAIVLGGVEMSVHLRDAKLAIEALEASCL